MSQSVKRQLHINNKLGLHARAAAKLVQCASGFEAQLLLSRNGRQINAKSIMGVMMLAATCGTTLQLEADGNDAQAAADAMEALVNDKFGEGE